jgi:hypothetical protein
MTSLTGIKMFREFAKYRSWSSLLVVALLSTDSLTSMPLGKEKREKKRKENT